MRAGSWSLGCDERKTNGARLRMHGGDFFLEGEEDVSRAVAICRCCGRSGWDWGKRCGSPPVQLRDLPRRDL